ncbi:MAG: phenylalanine--tRNA ligase subunit beta [Saprospiraceae bacterium]
MKISLNWIRDFLDLNKEPSEIADILTSLGLEVEGMEDVKPSEADLDQVLTGLVVECEPIPDTDHLSATKVDLGDGTHHSIVCGAPNVAAGQKVLVAVPGAHVFSHDGQLFQIGERKVRGVQSRGMICAQDELGIGHDHSGIMVLPEDTPLGISAAQYLGMKSDLVFEIGLTPNRADATNHLGCARDIAAYLRAREGASIELSTPGSKTPLPKGDGSLGGTVQINNTEACPRYTGVWLNGLEVKESPDWLKDRLLAVGQRPINNIVDVTNYVRVEMGQPLHAFDAAKIGKKEIRVQTLAEGTLFQALDETERKLFAEDLMICDGDDKPMCIGGVFGGIDSGVTDSTTSIFLESAYFNPNWIRRSMIRHNLRTDAAWTFEKGSDPNNCMLALQRAVQLILELAGGTVASEPVDIYPEPVEPARVEVSYNRVNQLIGLSLEQAEIRSILEALEIGIENPNETGFTAIIPTNKPDVTREADVIEEILRVYGLDNVPLPGQIKSSMEITPKPDPQAIQNMAANLLAACGFNECMALSLSNSDFYTGEKALMPMDKADLVYVHNTANQGLDCLRPSLLLGGLETIRHNQNRQNPNLRLFEFGKTYQAKPGEEQWKHKETFRLGIWLTGRHSAESWQPASKKAVDFYTLKAYVHQVLERFGVQGYQVSQLEPGSDDAFQFGLLYHRGPQELVRFGKVRPALCKASEIKKDVFYADFNFDNIIKALKNHSVTYSELSKFPAVRRDLALVLDRSVDFSAIHQTANKTVKKLLKEVNLFDVFEDESKLGKGKKSYAVSFIFENTEKTLKDKEIDAMMQQLQGAFEQKLNALIRQ